jgi:hypothetical protein
MAWQLPLKPKVCCFFLKGPCLNSEKMYLEGESGLFKESYKPGSVLSGYGMTVLGYVSITADM